MDSLKVVESALLGAGSMELSDLEQQLGQLLRSKADFGELFLQSIQSESWLLEDSIVKEGGFSLDKGVGVRTTVGEKTGFAYSEDITRASLAEAVRAARSITRSGQQRAVNTSNKNNAPALYSSESAARRVSNADKVTALQTVDVIARQIDTRVKEVNVSLSCVDEMILVMASDGTLVSDIRPLVRLDVSVLSEENGRTERGHAGSGGRFLLDALLTPEKLESLAQEAVRSASVNLNAIDAPAGLMTVVLGPGWPGVLLHEAVGHGLEGDFNRKGTSAFSNRMGEKVASPLCTVVDDGSLAARRGSLTWDDEGTPTEATVLIEKGILRNYLQDKLNARLMNMQPTGNGRRQSYSHLPLPRMTNTFMQPGSDTPQDVIGSVKAGLFAANFGGGQVDITSGKFVFSMTEAYLIENGRLTQPVKGATLIGTGPEIMGRVSMVGTDLKFDDGVGVCGKEGQSIPVGVGQPTLKINEIVVGGTSS